MIDPSYTLTNVTICVINYLDPTIFIYNCVNVLIHYFIPFLIQFLSITVLIIQTTRSRVRTIEKKNKNSFLTILKQKFQYREEFQKTFIGYKSTEREIISSYYTFFASIPFINQQKKV